MDRNHKPLTRAELAAVGVVALLDCLECHGGVYLDSHCHRCGATLPDELVPVAQKLNRTAA